MKINIIDKFEEKCFINLDWFYHSTNYDKSKYTSILTEGIKCNQLLNNPWGGTYNGIYYISLSKITIPDNECFLYYSTDRPSLVIDGIEPIKCEDIDGYDDYIYTKDPRRTGVDDEYQYYYFIKNIYIKGIVYNISRLIEDSYRGHQSLLNLLQLIRLLEELEVDIPIYDYSRRDKTLVHKINREKLKHYSRELL